MSEFEPPTTEIYSDKCRICLSTVEKDKVLSLFENFRDYFVYTYIQCITDVRINKNDGLPQKICKKCLLELDTAVQFKQKCENSNKILLGLGNKETALSDVDSNTDIKECLPEKDSSLKQELIDEEYVSSSEPYYIEIAVETTTCQNDFKNTVKVEDIHPKENLEYSQLQCHDCGEYFKTKCKLRVHWRKTHFAQSCVRVCQRCKLSFKSLHAYNNHLKNVTKRCRALGDECIRIEGVGKNRIFYCKECEYNTTYLPNIIHHCAKHTGKRQFQCDLCPKAFIQYASWSKHKEYTHKQYKLVSTCHICGKILKGKDHVKRHLSSHTDEKKFQCDICMKMYKRKCTLQNHMYSHKDKAFTCEICAKVFHHPSGLWCHIEYVHKRQSRQLIKCSICEYKTLKVYNIKQHERKHTDSNIACPQCGKFFEKAEKMLKHQRVHFDERKFQCRECERKYLSLDSLNKHLKAAHAVKLT